MTRANPREDHRSPASGGVHHADPLMEWSEGKNIRWKTPLPGNGHSTPIIWGNRVFVTAAVPVRDANSLPAGLRVWYTVQRLGRACRGHLNSRRWCDLLWYRQVIVAGILLQRRLFEINTWRAYIGL